MGKQYPLHFRNGSTMYKVKILFIVDDESDICITLKNVLEDSGFVVHAFDDPLLALENFRKDLYDLLILDIKMEKMDGFQLYEKIKKIDNKVKVCFLTARAFIDAFRNLKENQFIQKPIENEELIKKINEITS
jgi:two-component system, OmpR family, response regulator ChvI